MSRRPDPAKARRRYDAIAATYDRELARLRSPYETIRTHAVKSLDLAPGMCVLDVGCGTGASFPLLVAAVGPGGRVIGIDQSAGMLEVASQRIDREGWSNVELIEAPVQEAKVPAPADAALFFFTHDLLRTPAALDNILEALRPDATVVAAGVKRPPLWLAPLAVPLLLVARRFVTTTEGIARPWNLLSERLSDLNVEPLELGLAYVAVGRRSPSPSA